MTRRFPIWLAVLGLMLISLAGPVFARVAADCGCYKTVGACCSDEGKACPCAVDQGTPPAFEGTAVAASPFWLAGLIHTLPATIDAPTLVRPGVDPELPLAVTVRPPGSPPSRAPPSSRPD